MNLRTHHSTGKGKEEANEIDTVVLPPELSEAEVGRNMLRTGNKALSKFVERKDNPLIGVKGDHEWMLGDISNYLSGEESRWERRNRKASDAAKNFDEISEQMEPVLKVKNRHHAHAYKVAKKKLEAEGAEDKHFEPANTNQKIEVKKPSKFLPREDVISEFEAFHAGSQYGTASYVFYRVPDFIKSIFKKRPWPRGGKIAYMIDVLRNDLRQNYKNINVLLENLEKLKREHLNYWRDTRVSRRSTKLDNAYDESEYAKKVEADNMIHAKRLQEFQTKVCLIIFLLEDNFHSLHTGIENIEHYQRLYKANATVNIYGNGLVKSKNPPEVPTQFYADRDYFYQKEKELMEQMLSQRRNVIDAAKDELAHYSLSVHEYENWKNDNWRNVRIHFNLYKGAGCITGQAIQGFVIVMINMGIAIGLKSIVAAVAAGLYVLTTVADVIQTALRTHFENELIKGGYSPYEDVTRLATDFEHHYRTEGYIDANPEVEAAINKSRERVKLVHHYLDVLHHIEVVINELKGFVNTGVNTAGTVTGAPTSSTRPALNSQPREKRTSRIVTKTHTMFDKSYGQPVSSSSSRFKMG